MILGDICTRACAYCAVDTGKPEGIDLLEPIRVADTVEQMGLRYAVITSVDRDDLPDGGAFIFAQTIRQVRSRMPNTKIEVLIPDFQGSRDALKEGDGRRARHAQPQHRDRPPCLHPRPAQRRLRRVAGTSGNRQENRSRRCDKIRHDGRPRRELGRDHRDHERPAFNRLRPPDHRAVPASLQEARRAGEMVHPARVR